MFIAESRALQAVRSSFRPSRPRGRLPRAVVQGHRRFAGTAEGAQNGRLYAQGPCVSLVGWPMELIHDHLGSDLSLTRMAGEVRLSAHQNTASRARLT
jgi:hypothetical protein